MRWTEYNVLIPALMAACVQTVWAGGTGALPAAFVPNRGQWETPAKFVAHAGSMTAQLEKDAIVLGLRERQDDDAGRVVFVRLSFDGANESVILAGEDRQVTRRNYFVGSDRSRWRTDVPSYSSVLYRGLYDGVDVRVRVEEGHLEYDLMLSPGADLTQVAIRCEGIDGLDVAPDGTLVMATGLGFILQRPPATWYESANGERLPVECRYCTLDETRYRFDVQGLDAALALVIDPGLVWSTYLGGSDYDEVRFGNGIAANAAGEVLVGGRTLSADFPTTAADYDSTHNSSPDFYDAYIAKFDPTGSQVLWCTFLGGSDGDSAVSVIPDGAGGVIVGGRTFSPDFPTTPGAYDTSHNGGLDAFVAHLDPALAGAAQLVYSTVIGHSGDDYCTDVVRDASGVLTVVGYTDSFFFPTTAGAYDASLAGGFDTFVLRLDPSLAPGAQVTYSTFLGGVLDDFGDNIAVDANDLVTVAGGTYSPDFPTTIGAYSETFNGPNRDAFVSRLSLNGQGAADLVASTFLGGSGDDNGNAMDVDDSGVVVMAGWVASPDFPTTAGAYDTSHNGPVGGYDVYVSKLDATLSTLLASTFVGGASADDGANAVSLGASGIVTVVGFTGSEDYPTTFGAFDTTFNAAPGGPGDALVTRLDSSLSNLVYSTFLGGFLNGDSAFASAPTGPGRVAVGGWTFSNSFPTTAGAYDTGYNGAGDAFVTVLNVCPWDCGGDNEGEVGINDFLTLLAQWGGAGTCDFDDGGVGITDFLTLLANWGPCP